jgi:hypothetical protein
VGGYVEMAGLTWYAGAGKLMTTGIGRLDSWRVGRLQGNFAF